MFLSALLPGASVISTIPRISQKHRDVFPLKTHTYTHTSSAATHPYIISCTITRCTGNPSSHMDQVTTAELCPGCCSCRFRENIQRVFGGNNSFLLTFGRFLLARLHFTPFMTFCLSAPFHACLFSGTSSLLFTRFPYRV